MSLIHACRFWSALLSLSVYFLCVVVSAKKGNIYVFKFQTCSKYVRLIVPNEIMKLNRNNWCEILFSCTPHFGQIRFETVAFTCWNFLLLIHFQDHKKFQRAFKISCNFHDAINAVVFPLRPTKNLFSVTQKTFVSPKRNWKQYKFVGNKNCIMDSYIERRQQCTLFPPPPHPPDAPPQIFHSHFFSISLRTTVIPWGN